MNGPKPLRTRFNLVVTLVLIVIVDLSATSYITLTKNGYQNVVINIQENTGFSNCQQAIEDIKQLVRNTSTSFAQGLDRPVSFGNVVIIVPSSWASDPSCLTVSNASELAWARSSRADMQITSDHPVFGSFPYSFQYGGCKVSGLPINVPLSFITDNSITAKGKKMAREWAHYRYGVFDEGGIPDDPRHPSSYMIFQTENSEMVARANTCSDNRIPNGQWIGDECSTSTGNSSCEFVVDTYNPDIKSSLMYRPDLDNMEKFCTHSNHDDSVPSKLTYHCGSLSASEVIYKHPDFTPGFTTLNTSAEITFSVIQNPFSGYHVILDAASFPNSNLFNVAKSALMQFVNFLVSPVRLSIDTYSEFGWNEWQQPVELDNKNKISILNKLNDLIWNQTSNHNKFDQALENAQNRAYDGQDVIILTNIQSVIPDISNWITSYQEEKVNVHLVHFGVSSNEFVEIAKLAVYGSVHFTPNFPSSNLESSYTWATNTLQSIYSQTKTYRAKIFEQPIIKNSTEDVNKTGSFYLDSPASRLLLSLYYHSPEDNPNLDEFKLVQPNGNSVTIQKENVSKRDEFYALTVESAGELLQPGQWRYEILFNSAADDNKALRLDVFAEASNSSFIQLRTWNSAINNQAVDFTSGPVGLYAQLTQDRKPILGAKVIARVYAGFNNGTSSLVAQISLLDEGVADVSSGDGIYSAWLSKFSDSSLSYSVYYLAYGVNSMAKVDNGIYDRPPTTGSVIPMSNPFPVAEQFNRFGYGPSLQLSSMPSNSLDQIPPQRVTDLVVKSYDSSSRMAVLGWTAARDNFGTGDIVTFYELEQTVGSESPTKTTKSFSSEATLNWTVEVPPVNEGEYVRYRVRGRDSSSNWGDTSNVVSLAGPALPVNVNLSTGAIVGIVIGSIILLIIIIILIFCLCCPVEAKRKKRAATRKIQGVFKSKDKNKNNAAPIQRYEPPTTSWQSPVVNNEIPVNRRDSDVHIEPQTQVEIRQKKAGSTAEPNRGSERIYFGQQDLQHIKQGPRSETYSERGTEEMVKRAPSMDLQLATILKLNSSNFSVDRLGLDEQDASGPKPIQVVNPKTYARPYKPNPNANRPASNGPYYNPNKPISRSENNLYYTDVELKPTGPSSRSTPSNSYLSVYAEQRAEVVPQQSTQSSLANSLRAGMRNEEWQDSNSFVYTDPRFDNQSNRGSSFDPQLHPANQVGLPPSLPSMPPPILARNYVADDRSSNASSMSGVNQQQMGRSSSKPSLISAV